LPDILKIANREDTFYGFKKGLTIRLSIRTFILKPGINQGMSKSNIIRDPEKCGGEPGFGLKNPGYMKFAAEKE
jgi:hypothetical protein